MGASLGRSGSRRAHSEINVTPFVDVMLVLLIIFMVVTPMLQKGVDVKLPPAAYGVDHPDNEDSVTLAVRVDQQIYLDMLPVPESDLVTKIREKYDMRSDKTIYMKADENLDYGDVMRVMNLVREGGVDVPI